jgi:hypothetical protein
MTTEQQTLETIAALMDAGFTANKWGDRLDRGNVGTYFDDNTLQVVLWNNPRSQVIEWKASLPLALGADKLIATIETMTN